MPTRGVADTNDASPLLRCSEAMKIRSDSSLVAPCNSHNALWLSSIRKKEKAIKNNQIKSTHKPTTKHHAIDIETNCVVVLSIDDKDLLSQLLRDQHCARAKAVHRRRTLVSVRREANSSVG
jgi:hypothetical protein